MKTNGFSTPVRIDNTEDCVALKQVITLNYKQLDYKPMVYDAESGGYILSLVDSLMNDGIAGHRYYYIQTIGSGEVNMLLMNDNKWGFTALGYVGCNMVDSINEHGDVRIRTIPPVRMYFNKFDNLSYYKNAFEISTGNWKLEPKTENYINPILANRYGTEKQRWLVDWEGDNNGPITSTTAITIKLINKDIVKHIDHILLGRLVDDNPNAPMKISISKELKGIPIFINLFDVINKFNDPGLPYTAIKYI